jgi:hypothetical protein
MLQPPVSTHTVAAVDGVDLASTNRGPGSCVSWRDGTEAHVAIVRGRVPDHAALEDTIASIRGQVSIEFDPREPGPVTPTTT